MPTTITWPYVKRFYFEPMKRKQSYIGENMHNRLFMLSNEPYPRVRVTMGGKDEYRGSFDMEMEDFTPIRSYKARGRRLTSLTVKLIEEIEPLKRPEPEPETLPGDDDGKTGGSDDENLDPDAGKSERGEGRDYRTT